MIAEEEHLSFISPAKYRHEQSLEKNIRRMLKDNDLHVDKEEAANYSLFVKLPLVKQYLDLRDPAFKPHIKEIESEHIYLAKYLSTSKDQERNHIESDDELMQIETL